MRRVDEKQIYTLLGQMLEAAEREDAEAISALNRSYDAIFNSIVHHPPTKRESAYDNCRQSCVLALETPDMYDAFMADARKRFLKIKEPKD